MKPEATLAEQKLGAAWRMLTSRQDGMFLDYAVMFLEIAEKAGSAAAGQALPHVRAAIRAGSKTELRDSHTATAVDLLRPHAAALGLA